jgi:hypothetical protein
VAIKSLSAGAPGSASIDTQPDLTSFVKWLARLAVDDYLIECEAKADTAGHDVARLVKT